MKTLDERINHLKSAKELSYEYADHLAEMIKKIDFEAMERFCQLLVKTRDREKTVYICGNGGSAATANHFANDLCWGTRNETHPNGLKAVSLSANMPVFSALGNDTGYENVFMEQMRTLFCPGDVLVAISASGNSENVLKAIQWANERDGASVGLVGFDGGKMKGLCHELLHVETAIGEYCPVEDAHMAICHTAASYLRRAV